MGMDKVTRRDVISTLLLVVLFFCSLIFLPASQSMGQTGPRVILLEDDGTSGPAYKIVFPDGSLTISGAVGTVIDVTAIGDLPCNEGLNAGGNASNELECSAYVPNLVVTVNLEDADCDGADDPFDCCTGAGTGSCDDIMSMSHGLHGIAGGSTDLDQWDIAYVKAADSELYDADGDLADSWPGIGLATADAVDGTELVILQVGCVRNDAWNWGTLGPEGNIYLSDDPTTTSGLTQTPLGTAGDCHQKVGWAYSDDVACFNFPAAYHVVD